MLKKENSLRKKKEIDNVFKNGKSFYGELIGLKLIKNNLNLNRYCIIISAKISKKASDRNKIRRQIKAIIFNLEPLLKSGYDCLIINNKEILNKSFLEKKDIIENAFKGSGFYKK